MTHSQKKDLAQILVAAVLFGAAVLAPLDGLWKLAAYLVPYLVIG